MSIGFETIRHEVDIEENLAQNTVVKVLELDQEPIPGLDIQCQVMRVKDQRGAIINNVFKGVYNANNQCELQIDGVIDKETIDTLEVMLKLKTQSAFVNPARMIANIFLR